MKRFFSLTMVAVLSVVLLTSLTPKKKKKAAKQFRGIVTYSISYESEALSDVQIAKLPTKTTVKMYDGMSSFDIAMGPVIQSFIINPTTDKYIVMLEFGLKKAALVKKYSEMSNDSLEQYTTQIDYSSDTKIIAGYTCKKAVVTFTPKEGVEGEERMFSVFYSEDLGSAQDNIDGPYKGIPGLLLESYDVKPGLITKMVATEVKKGKVKDLDFLMPSDYKEFTDEEELQKYLMEQ
jgi:GLPGLI family protein